MYCYLILVLLAIPFVDVSAAVKWLLNTSVAVFLWACDTLPGVLNQLARIAISYLLAVVKWNCQKLPIIAAWLLRTVVDFILPSDSVASAAVKWLLNTSVAVFLWACDTLLGALNRLARIAISYLLHAFKAVVNWNHQKLTIIAAWFLRTLVGSKLLEFMRVNRQTILLASALVCIITSPLLIPGIILTALGFGFQGIKRGSRAATYQSGTYGGHTRRFSSFSAMQSAGMRRSPGMELALMITNVLAAILFVFAWSL
ncbi:hypothetical protein B0H11DRAFT_2128197, partial [Mycena galericulata]